LQAALWHIAAVGHGDDAARLLPCRYKEAFRSRAATIGQNNGSIAPFMVSAYALETMVSIGVQPGSVD